MPKTGTMPGKCAAVVGCKDLGKKEVLARSQGGGEGLSYCREFRCLGFILLGASLERSGGSVLTIRMILASKTNMLHHEISSEPVAAALVV